MNPAPVWPEFGSVELRTARLHLRAVVMADASAFLRLHQDPEVMRYWATGPWADLEEAERRIEQGAQSTQTRSALRLGVFRAEGDELIGTCTLWRLDPACRRAELGYLLARPFWGQGYAQEAVSRLLDWGFGQLGLNRVEADIDPRNAPSARLLRALGFRQEGFLPERWIVGDEVTDTALFGLLARHWPPAATDPAPAQTPVPAQRPLHHVSIGVRDLDRAAPFYDAILAPLGLVRVWDELSAASPQRAVGYGRAGQGDLLALKESASAHAPGVGAHWAWGAPSAAAVRAFHAAALAHGGADNGPPGLRPHYGEHYYAAFVVDPEGHRLEAVFK